MVVTVPSRPVGDADPIQGAYLMRRGEELVPVPPETLRQIFDEAEPDHSARICPMAELQ